jgi:F-type H+-transporting ATPase subunit epsilon
MLLEIITPEKTFFKEEVDLVRVPGSQGSFAMKNSHAPIISTLEPGLIKVNQDPSERYFEIFDQAIVEQHGNKVTILTNKVQETFPIYVR